jgi:hypothetical protein
MKDQLGSSPLWLGYKQDTASHLGDQVKRLHAASGAMLDISLHYAPCGLIGTNHAL